MVLTHDTDAAIKRAMTRATARNTQAIQVDAVAAGYDRTVYYECGAFSHVGSHRVTLHYSVEGITAVCDCEAGQQGRICHHVAAALMAEEMPQIEPESVAEPWKAGNFISDLMAVEPEPVYAPSRVDTMTDFERIVMAHIGSGFWIEDGTVGVIDNRDADEVHAKLRRAAEMLGCAGYRVQRERHEDRINRLRLIGGTPSRVSF